MIIKRYETSSKIGSSGRSAAVLPSIVEVHAQIKVSQFIVLIRLAFFVDISMKLFLKVEWLRPIYYVTIWKILDLA